MKYVLLSLLFSAFTMNAFSEIHLEAVQYTQGSTQLEGYIAYDDSIKGKRPGILICHEWMGLSDYEKSRAKQLAELGYLAFCADIYGKGIRPTTPKEASAQAGKYKSDRPLLRARVNAALNELLKDPLVDPLHVATIGYCFGGTAALELARSGADISGVVTFHGGLSSPTPQDAKNIKCKVLVLHGADDPNVNADEVKAFQEEMRNSKVDWQMVSYGGTVHAFTNPKAGNDPSRGAAYNEKSDKRSWEAMKQFFTEIFPKPTGG